MARLLRRQGALLRLLRGTSWDTQRHFCTLFPMICASATHCRTNHLGIGTMVVILRHGIGQEQAGVRTFNSSDLLIEGTQGGYCRNFFR